jgi:hypothetical protein
MAKRQGQRIIDKSLEPSSLRSISIIDHVSLFSWGRHRGSGREPQGVRATIHLVAPVPFAPYLTSRPVAGPIHQGQLQPKVIWVLLPIRR